ncbi:MAG: hypothetical protein RDU89_01435 [bacterium]|nr:hypothetical protein [bacterium]
MSLFLINLTVLMRVDTPTGPLWRQLVLPVYAVAMLSCGLGAGISGLIAVRRRRERSWLVWLAMLPGLLVVAFLLGEFLVPH